jgi:pimeloyl-ACP methyl ester carboxylesterase
VLLWLAGGPGGSELGWVRHYNADLEKHFVVVNWEQRAAGKNFLQLYAHRGSITPQQYVKDGLRLADYLRHRFHQNKIYVVGHSWGTFLGVWLVQQKPQWFYAYVGAAQMVNGAVNDRLWYEVTLQRARQAGDTGAVKTLEGYGPPSLKWYRENPITLTQKIANINFINDKYMAQDMEAHGGSGDNGDLLAAVNTPEYRPIDKLFWLAGPAFTFETVYPQLYPVNLVKQASYLNVPVYFIEGRWDINAPTVLVKQYYRALHSPHKQLVWFERSGHNPPYQEPAKFNAFLIHTVLRETYRSPLH